MNIIKKKLLTFLIIFLFLILNNLHPGISKTKLKNKIIQTKQKLHQINKEIRYQRLRFKIMNQREKEISHQLNTTQNKLKITQENLEAVKVKLIHSRLELKMIKNKLLETKNNLKNHRLILKERLRDIYENTHLNYITALLGSEDFSDFLTRLDFLRIIVKSDLELLEKIRSEEKNFSIQKSDYEVKIEDYSNNTKELSQKEYLFSSLKLTRQKLLNEVIWQRNSISNYIVELEHSSVELERQIQTLIRESQNQNKNLNIYQSTDFIWPLNSHYVTSSFGWRDHPIYGRIKFHTGIDIAADYSSPIYACADGIVIYAGYLGGYGYTVIIDHGGGTSSLYGHCSNLYAKTGQNVKQGEKIAAVGSTGASTGPHLHFEVRQNGTPVDPNSKF
ncbi:MAG: peptidoglycan DD-metalloendopeptidase family protein [Armatimonadetes bacterium]|nr:peptidoglycan DD-metalloendopeptidase family protein [Armatimonadota bacterium]